MDSPPLGAPMNDERRLNRSSSRLLKSESNGASSDGTLLGVCSTGDLNPLLALGKAEVDAPDDGPLEAFAFHEAYKLGEASLESSVSLGLAFEFELPDLMYGRPPIGLRPPPYPPLLTSISTMGL